MRARQVLFHLVLAVGLFEQFFVCLGVGVLRAQAHVGLEDAVAAREVDGLHAVPLLELTTRRSTGSGSKAAAWCRPPSSAFRSRPAATPVDWCVTEGCNESSWFSMKNFQFECCITRWQVGTTSTSPSGERSHMSSKATLASPRKSSSDGPDGARLANTKPRYESTRAARLHAAIRVVARHARAVVALHQRDGSRSCRRGGSSRRGTSRRSCCRCCRGYCRTTRTPRCGQRL